jgi:hypothetical protein
MLPGLKRQVWRTLCGHCPLREVLRGLALRRA